MNCKTVVSHKWFIVCGLLGIYISYCSCLGSQTVGYSGPQSRFKISQMGTMYNFVPDLEERTDHFSFLIEKHIFGGYFDLNCIPKLYKINHAHWVVINGYNNKTILIFL